MLADALNQTLTFTLNQEFDEFEIFTQHIAPAIKKYVNAACFDICEYTVTKILNNAKDHSRGKTVQFTFKIDSKYLSCSCQDNGIGVFANLQQALGFVDTRDTLLQLSKGKLTSDAVNHTGEGLFFTCRSVDEFSLSANNFCLLRDNKVKDWSFSMRLKQK